jgi:ribosomal protein L11 methyltransferase
MFSVRIDVEPEHYDGLIGELWDAGTLGVVDGDGFVEAFFKDEAAAARFGTPQLAPEVDWVQKTKESFRPLSIGQRFFVVAPWHTDPTPPGRFRIEINPGMQFGTGEHRTTQLCMEAMERVIRPGDRVLDVGAGTGILSAAAKLLGAGTVVACDIDPESASVVPPIAPFFIGSVDAVRDRSFDVAVANIAETVLGELHPELERVAPRRILSGFQNDAGEWEVAVEGVD